MTETALHRLYEEALALARREGDADADGEGVAAAALTERGAILLGVWVDAKVDSAALCAETGPICQARRDRERIVASICVRATASGPPRVLAACGVCQERLACFGPDVRIAVHSPDAPGYVFRPLRELRPDPWWDAL